MIVTFVVPSTRRPIGGITGIYEFANGLARLGTTVQLVHLKILDGHIDRLDQLAWFEFEPALQHVLVDDLDPRALPPADVVDLTGVEFFSTLDVFSWLDPRTHGLPFLFFEGFGIFPEAVDDRALYRPCPKVCIARWLAGVATRKGVPADQLVYVPYGIKHSKYRVTRPLDARPLQVSMLYNPHYAKAPLVGMEALARVKQRRPELRVVLFGTTDPEWELPEGFEFVHDPPQSSLVDEIYNGSRVFVCPSTVEGFGFCSVEAMACGAALATTANGGSDDYAVHGETALVSPPLDAEALGRHVEELLADDARRVAIATRGREFVRRFDWDESARALAGFLEAYVAHPDRHGAGPLLRPPSSPARAREVTIVRGVGNDDTAARLATAAHTDAEAARLRGLYLDLLRGALTHMIYRPIDVDLDHGYEMPEMSAAALEAYEQGEIDWRQIRAEGKDWPMFAQTMVGVKRLRNVQSCVERVLADGVPGDLIEAGVWRGGVGILMRGVLAAYGDTSRAVVVADSFAGLPPPNTAEFPADAGDRHHTAGALAVPLEEVRRNFRLYGLLDERVEFVEGWFRDTLPLLADRTWAVVRVDGDMYESTTEALEHLYPNLAVGGFCIIDDFWHAPCRQAVDDFRAAHGVDDPIRMVDWTGGFWRRRS